MDGSPPLPVAEFAFPGPLRDKLVAAVLAGRKTTTTSLRIEYDMEDELLPSVGGRHLVIDSMARPVAVIETAAVEQVLLGSVSWAHASCEGEGHPDLQQWRNDHESFWHSQSMRDFLGDPGFTVDDDTPVVLERFRVVEILPDPPARLGGYP
ncbi:ASCH domain-containing protein [Arthrobacter zhaoguopingii]|uniref:ASCH domain-containing protein n=1 Tax=Arthrobacter zhaoguopingii TaxID=2681491 RepID=UPI00135BE9C0|nr:ASCH domain-containing protein [Arthrobacter zhaoguopingii]